MESEAIENMGYSLLKDLCFEIGDNETCLNLCFWVYFPNSTPFPSIILHQLHSENPFLALSEDKRLILSPSFSFRKESSDSGNIVSVEKPPSAISNVALPLGKWAHIGCQVDSNNVRIYLDGKVVGETPLDLSMENHADFQIFPKVTLSAMHKGYEGLIGYVYNEVVLPSTSSISNHHTEDSPLWLCVDNSSVCGIELEGDGIWKIVSGKASCCKLFSSDVLLLDAFGELVDKELEVVASLIYANNHAAVEKSKDGEAPLLITCNGHKFPSEDKPSYLLGGRASFQLNISRLSSECDNRLFCVKFDVPKMRKFPFFEAYTPPIRCVLKTCDTKVSTITWKKLPSGFRQYNGSPLPQSGGGHSELLQKPVCEAIPSLPSSGFHLYNGSNLPQSDVEISELQQKPVFEAIPLQSSSGFHLYNGSRLSQLGIGYSALHQKPVYEAIPYQPSSGFHPYNGSSFPQSGVGHSELQQKSVFEAIPSLPSKRKSLEQDTSLTIAISESYPQRSDENCSSYTVSATKNAVGTSLESIQENYGGMDNSASDSESIGARNSELNNIPCNIEPTSDSTIFRYCLGGLSDRAQMLKDVSLFASEQEIAEMAEKVSFFSGCSHHRQQIMIAKKLLEEGERAWNSISQNSDRVLWDNVVFEIEEQFMKIACCSTRSLTQQDLNFLRRISGGNEYIIKDDFDKMWCWLYPVAFTISRQRFNALWASMSPKWIEGFVTKEEVEYALQSPHGIQEPGTFILRFPTTRSWPHPDAGSLVVSYVGRDFTLHHRQLSLDYSSDFYDTNQKPLQELILSEPELSRVGRMMSDLTV